PNLNSSRIKFYAFDLAIPNMGQLSRLKLLKILCDRLSLLSIDNPIIKVDAVILYNDKDVQHYADKYIAQGHEGIILRDTKAQYQFGKRPMTMVKLKRTMSDEFRIIDIVPQNVNPDLGLFVCRTKE